MRRFTFEPRAFEEFSSWAIEDRKLYQRLAKLIVEAARTPFEGTGKPEPLKANYKGYWSRRITDEHRLIYKVADDAITIIACRGHYE